MTIRATQSFVEVLTSNDAPEIRVTQTYAEVLNRVYPRELVVTQVFVEILASMEIGVGFDITEPPDTININGDVVSGEDITGSVDIVEDADTILLLNLQYTGNLDITEDQDLIAITNQRRHIVTVAVISEDQ